MSGVYIKFSGRLSYVRMRQLDQDAFYKAPTIYGIYEDWYA